MDKSANKDTHRRNLFLTIKKHLKINSSSRDQIVSEIENDFIIHTNSSEYSKDIKNWFK